MFRQVISVWFVFCSIGLPVLANSSNDDLKVAEEFNGKEIGASADREKK